MKISIYVEAGSPGDKEFISFRGEYADPIKAEEGLRELIMKYMKVVPPTIDPKTGQEETIPW